MILADTSTKKTKFTIVTNSDLPIPKHLNEYIGKRRRIWGRVILNYPVKYITPAVNNSHNPRLDPQSQTAKVKESLREYGFIGMIPVTPAGYNKEKDMVVYEILNGDVRYFAMLEDNIKTVNIQVFEGSEKELAPLRVALNSNPDLKPADLALYFYNELYIKYGYTHEEIARLCTTDTKKIGRTWVTAMCSIAEHAIEQVIDAWRDGLIKKTHALNIIQSCRANKNEQLKALRLAIAGIQAKDINQNTIKTEEVKTQAMTISPIKKQLTTTIATTSASKSNRNEIKLQSKFAIINRYKKLKSIDTHASRLLAKEYEWILCMDDEEDDE